MHRHNFTFFTLLVHVPSVKYFSLYYNINILATTINIFKLNCGYCYIRNLHTASQAKMCFKGLKDKSNYKSKWALRRLLEPGVCNCARCTKRHYVAQQWWQRPTQRNETRAWVSHCICRSKHLPLVVNRYSHPPNNTRPPESHTPHKPPTTDNVIFGHQNNLFYVNSENSNSNSIWEEFCSTAPLPRAKASELLLS
jgi:hypothetical protein